VQAQQIDFLDLLNGTVQYVVPRWQRRYCWNSPDITRLVEDLVTIARSTPGSSHYGGTLITFDEQGPAGVVKTTRVIDGQQRLATVSILLACLAERLDEEGPCGEWTAEVIREDRLTNPRKSDERLRKLRLQDGDDQEYRAILNGQAGGPGAVAEAYRTLHRLVRQHETADLLEGLGRFRVVAIGLKENDDPQQIFESLNATGRPLSESEKLKNWLLMGHDDAKQQELYENQWRVIEQSLGATLITQPVDVFLRDLLRWKTGELAGISRTYEGLRRCAIKNGLAQDRAALCHDLARQAELYGKLTGTNVPHHSDAIESELQHLRALGFHTHRPFSLRLLDDARRNASGATDAAVAEVFAAVNTWIIRLWLANVSMTGLNKAMAELAQDAGPSDGDDYASYWIAQIQARHLQRIAVPRDQPVRDGVRGRSAYGGSANGVTRAILCALMEAEHGEESPSRHDLTIEHIMPQKLTGAWRADLGDGAEEIHGEWRNRLANLTLRGGSLNSAAGAAPFERKKVDYASSPIGLTRELATEEQWDVDALERRATQLAESALALWPWLDGKSLVDDQSVPVSDDYCFRWRFEGETWRYETSGAQTVLKVAGALLDHDETNAQKLSGPSVMSHLHRASKRASIDASTARLRRLKEVPGHPRYVLYPDAKDHEGHKQRCLKMAERCGASLNIEILETATRRLWRSLLDVGLEVPGAGSDSSAYHQLTGSLNSDLDKVRINLGEATVDLHVQTGPSGDRTSRAWRFSELIHNHLQDQKPQGDPQILSQDGFSISISMKWDRDDEDGWSDAANWINTQYARLAQLAKL